MLILGGGFNWVHWVKPKDDPHALAETCNNNKKEFKLKFTTVLYRYSIHLFNLK